MKCLSAPQLAPIASPTPTPTSKPIAAAVGTDSSARPATYWFARCVCIARPFVLFSGGCDSRRQPRFRHAEAAVPPHRRDHTFRHCPMVWVDSLSCRPMNREASRRDAEPHAGHCERPGACDPVSLLVVPRSGNRLSVPARQREKSSGARSARSISNSDDVGFVIGQSSGAGSARSIS
jgi:hypothetical protein